MNIADVRKRAFAMPLTSPAFPPGPYRFINREYLIITYRTDREALEKVVPEPVGGAHRDPALTIATLGAAIDEMLDELVPLSRDEVRRQRRQKFLEVG